ncbi:MAG TPA: hypothetical protein VEO73_02840 [Gemmatimonadales bacterium]|nr:hypothetical protein [Gemmatimonadales bacterium]
MAIVIAARRPLVRIAAWAACLLIGLTGGLSPALAAKRIELYDAEGQHHGYAIVQHRAGRVDYYNLRERRSGWGRVNPLSERYRVDFFAADGIATGYALVDRETGRVEFFDHASRLVGCGALDNTGRVTRFDLSGRRRSDTALPIPKQRPASWEQPSK